MEIKGKKKGIDGKRMILIIKSPQLHIEKRYDRLQRKRPRSQLFDGVLLELGKGCSKLEELI